MANYPIVKVKITDEISLDGLFLEAVNSKTCLVHVHGTAGNFYENTFIKFYGTELPKLGISFLSTNNRGNAVMHDVPGMGAAAEKFEDCVFDINAWIKFVLDKGYKKIILQGHSLGTEKAVYYMNFGKYKNKIGALILLGFADSVGTQEKYVHSQPKLTNKNLLEEANKLIAEGRGYEFLRSSQMANCGETPFSAISYKSFFSPDSELSKTMPLRNNKHLPRFKNIKVPILGVIGDKQEYTVIPIREAMKLLEKENPLAKCHQVKGCDHCFNGKEKELINIVKNFLKKHK